MTQEGGRPSILSLPRRLTLPGGTTAMQGRTRSQMQISSMGIAYMKKVAQSRTMVDLQVYKSEADSDMHSIPLKELCSRLGTDAETGLTSKRAGENLALNGPNCLTPPPDVSVFMIFVRNLFTGFALLLWSGAILCFISHIITIVKGVENNSNEQLYMGVVLLVVVVLTGTFAFYQEERNVKIMDGFKKMMPSFANVIRDGKLVSILCEELVVGDLVEVRAGNRVPADIRIIECRNLKVDNSSITGESELQNRGVQCTDNNPLETENMAFSTTNAVEGMCKGLVVATGDNSLIGRIAGLTSCLEYAETPIRREINRFIQIITKIAFTIGGVFFVVSLAIGDTWIDAVVFLIGIIVANVPEGLLVTLTACLTLTAKRMAKKNCLVKNLESIETLGSTSVICSDKTGTLTQNKMTVAHIWVNNECHETETSGLAGCKMAFDVTQMDFVNLLRIAALCSNAEFEPDQLFVNIQQRKVKGDASEAGILKFCERILGDGNVIRLRSELPKVCEIPFNSTNKYQLSIHFIPDDSSNWLLMKGAPEIVFEHCDTIQIEGAEVPFCPVVGTNYKAVLKKAVLTLGTHGERVMAFCSLRLGTVNFPPDFPFDSEHPNFPTRGLKLAGLMSLIDPPRATVPDAVSKCRRAGIRVIMVTGDHPVTAMSIARKVGIISAESMTIYDWALKLDRSVSDIRGKYGAKCQAIIVTGTELRSYTSTDMDFVVRNYTEIVFARTSPQQKLLIVEAVQRSGAIVAVTGDGVNDSPALKKADIGIAMGITGSDVSKQAAKMILLDDNFSSIVTGIEEGRLIFDNLKKSIAYVLTSNLPEIMPFVALVVFAIPLPLSVIAILCIDVGTDLWPAISLAYENPEADLMHRPPRDPNNDRLVNERLIMMTYGQIGVIQCFAGFLNYFLVMAEHGFMPSDLYGIRNRWRSRSVRDLQDHYGQEWTYEQRQTLEIYAVSAFFIAILETQWTDLLICKTRKLSLLQQGMRNWVLNFGLIFETCIAIAICYSPWSAEFLRMYPVDKKYWLPPFPFALFIVIFDEFRRLMIRLYPGGFVERCTYY